MLYDFTILFIFLQQLHHDLFNFFLHRDVRRERTEEKYRGKKYIIFRKDFPAAIPQRKPFSLISCQRQRQSNLFHYPHILSLFFLFLLLFLLSLLVKRKRRRRISLPGISMPKIKFGLPLRPNSENAPKRLIYSSICLSLFFFFCFFSLFFSWKRKRKEDYANLIIIMYNIKKQRGTKL